MTWLDILSQLITSITVYACCREGVRFLKMFCDFMGDHPPKQSYPFVPYKPLDLPPKKP